MRARLTLQEFTAVRRRIILYSVAIISPVAIAISIYTALWDPTLGFTHLHTVIFNILQSIIITIAIVIGSEIVLKIWLARHQRWAVDGEEPTDGDRRDLIRLPTRAAATVLAAVVLATAITVVVSITTGTPAAISGDIGFAFGLTGFTYALIVYLEAERALQPLFALAMRDTDVPDRRLVGVKPRLLASWMLGSAVPLVFLIALPFRPHLHNLLPLTVPVLYMAIGGLVLGGIATALVARSVAEPITSVRRGMQRVEAGDLDAEMAVTTPGDLGQLEAGFNAMVSGLRERQRIEDLFGRHVGDDVARQALATGIDLEGEIRTVTAFFVDLVGSTAFAESSPPAVVVARINQLFQTVFDVVSSAGGWINKFEGDGCLCVFGAPSPLADHSGSGLRAARLLGQRLSALDLAVGIGVACGEVVAGNVGSVERFEYTVIGRPINEAARLTEAAKFDPTHVLATLKTVEQANAQEATHWQSRDSLELRGVVDPVPVARPDSLTR